MKHLRLPTRRCGSWLITVIYIICCICRKLEPVRFRCIFGWAVALTCNIDNLAVGASVRTSLVLLSCMCLRLFLCIESMLRSRQRCGIMRRPLLNYFKTSFILNSAHLVLASRFLFSKCFVFVVCVTDQNDTVSDHFSPVTVYLSGQIPL